MDIKNFVLSYYKDSTEDFHIHKVENVIEAKKPHTHEYFQIYFIVKGSLEHYVETEHSLLVHGDMFIIPPGITHYILPSKDAIFYSFSFMPDFFGEPTVSNRFTINFLHNLKLEKNGYIRPKISVDTSEIRYIESIMEHIIKEFTKKPVGYNETIRAYAILLLTMLARSYFEKSKISLKDSFESNKQFMLHCITYIDRNCTDNISLSEIAKRSAMSKSRFCTLFSQLTGYSFNHYINLCRIKKAEDYLRQGYKITALYGLCGYNDFSTFYRNFKKITGLSPKDYKQQHENNSIKI